MIVETNYLFSKRIDIAEYFGDGKDEAFVELRELGGVAAAQLKKASKDEEELTKYFLEKLPWMIVDHNFFKDEAHKMDAAEVALMIGNRAELCFDLAFRYLKEVLFIHGKKSEGN